MKTFNKVKNKLKGRKGGNTTPPPSSSRATSTSVPSNTPVPIPGGTTLPVISSTVNSASAPLSANKISPGQVAFDVVEKGLIILEKVSDWFPPLKMATGALCECIRIYKVSLQW